jgi:hypothetical protein
MKTSTNDYTTTTRTNYLRYFQSVTAFTFVAFVVGMLTPWPMLMVANAYGLHHVMPANIVTLGTGIGLAVETFVIYTATIAVLRWWRINRR